MKTYYYSTPYITGGGGYEQREFGKITTKILRPMKAGIGRTRRKLADKIYESGDKAIEKVQEYGNPLTKDPIHNKELRNKILREEAPKARATVSYKAGEIAQAGGGGATMTKNQADTMASRGTLRSVFVKKGDKALLKKTLRGDRSGIAMNNQVGEETLAHELGHAKGRVSGGLRGKISKADPRNAEGYQGSVALYPSIPQISDQRVSFKDAVKDHLRNIKNGNAIVAEENAASIEGLKMLKKHGATQEEVFRAAQNLKRAGDTYRAVTKKANRSSLGRIIDIPSRRGKGVMVQ